MSAILEQLLRDSGDAERLSDIARNDAAEEAADEAFRRRVDAQYEQAKSDGSLQRARDERALAEQMQRQGVRS